MPAWSAAGGGALFRGYMAKTRGHHEDQTDSRRHSDRTAVPCRLARRRSAPASAAGTTYYVSAGGSDANDGKSPESAWETLDKVNATALQPGDSVSFRRGDVFSGGIVVGRSGTSRARITLNAYGSGDLPTITGGLTGIVRQAGRRLHHRGWPAGGFVRLCGVQCPRRPWRRAELRRQEQRRRHQGGRRLRLRQLYQQHACGQQRHERQYAGGAVRHRDGPEMQ